MSFSPGRLAALVFALSVTCTFLRTPPDSAASTQTPSSTTAASADEVRARCIVCHAVPEPDILPKAAWRDELARMMLIQEGVPEPAGAIGMIPLPPDWRRILRFYQERAPEKLPDPQPWPSVDNRLGFVRRNLALPKGGAAAVANVRFLDIDGDRKLDIVASDMRSGQVVAGLAKSDFALGPLAKLRHPAHIEQVDLDKDGIEDLLIADLGSFLPADHQEGAVYWLRGTRKGFRPVVLASGLGRVADVRAADFDGDGDLDVIAAVFGWRRTGGITLLENRTIKWASPVFVARVVDKRTGSIHVPIADLNKDGRPDFVALLAQEHESVVAFVNNGKNLEFTPQTIYAAPHPNWGSSGIDLVDMDRDGDQDVLMTNGDAFDDFIVKPYHGVQWLENTGSYPYVPHWLAQLPGAHRAQGADVDGDGDLDIVASVMIAGGEMRTQMASLVWLEQVQPGAFERRTLEAGTPYHATLDVGDFNGDGKPDLAVGWFWVDQSVPGWIDLWSR
jgi:hypothetical protein